MKRYLPFLVLAAVMGLALPALAAPPVTETSVEHGLTDTFVDFFDCQGTPYEITVTFSIIEHSTVFADGRAHFTFTQTGTFEAVALDPSQPDASGHFAVWGGFNQNNSTVNGTFTFNAIGEYEDGSPISTHSVDHFNVVPSGTEFFFSRCHD